MGQVTFKDVQKLAECAIVFQKYISAVCKTTNATTALSQLFVADYYKGNCINTKGYDVLTHDGKKIQVKGIEIIIIQEDKEDFISLTDMLKAKDGDFFISYWLRNRNTVEFLGIWESVYNPSFN
jgi:hypothetical protein